jgi:protein ImuB
MTDPCFAGLFTPQGSGDTLAEIARAFSPRYERRGDGLIVLDVSGLTRMFGDARAIAGAIRRDADRRGLVVHVALAGTTTAAQLLARAHPGVTIVEPGHEAAALAPVSIEVAPAAMRARGQGDPRASIGVSSRRGWGPAASEKKLAHAANRPVDVFKSWGIRTLGQLAALPAADLAARIGREAARWQALARGEEVMPLVPEAPEERFEASIDLEWPIEGLEPLSFVLTRLLEPLTTRLERCDRAVAVLHVRFVLTTDDAVERSVRVASPAREVRTLRGLVLLDLESHPLDAAVDRVELFVDPTPGKVLQHTLFERPHPTPEQLSTLVARLSALMGQDRIGAPAALDTHRPGAFAMKEFAPARAGGADGSAPAAMRARGQGDPRASVGVSSQREWGPAAIEEVSAPAATPASMLRRSRQPVPARVAVENGRAVRVTTDRQGFGGGVVLSAAGPWRASGEWWSTPYDHAEWDVALADGAVYRIFQDHGSGRWFVEGIVD